MRRRSSPPRKRLEPGSRKGWTRADMRKATTMKALLWKWGEGRINADQLREEAIRHGFIDEPSQVRITLLPRKESRKPRAGVEYARPRRSLSRR